MKRPVSVWKILLLIVVLCPLLDADAGPSGVHLSGVRPPGTANIRMARAQSAAVSAEQLLSAMGHARRWVAYTGTEIMTQSGAPPMRMRVWRDGAKRRLEFLSPTVRQGDVVVDDGSRVWLYHRKDNTAVQTLGRSDSTRSNAERMRRNFKAQVTGMDMVAGRRAWVVALTPRAGAGVRYKFWIDQATKARLRRERYTAAGQRDQSTTLTSVRFGPVPSSRFQWSPPPGAVVTRTTGTLYSDLARARAAASWVRYPHYRPSGYVFESAVIDAAKGEAWLRYTNGRRRFSIFQQRVRGAAGGSTQPNQVNGGWYWKRAGSRFLAVDIPDDQVRSVAQSMR
jgi:outer membrane lipoprotein-sorting protein